MTEDRHDILPRIIALLLGLALLAERVARRPLALRLTICDILLPALFAALTLIDFPDDSRLSQTVQQTLDSSENGDSAAALIHLAMVLRAIAAVLMHECLTNGTPRSDRANHAITLSLSLDSRPMRRRFMNGIGFVHDTS